MNKCNQLFKKLDFISFSKIYHLDKSQAPEWEKIVATHIHDKEMVPSVLKPLDVNYKKKKKKQFLKMS